MEKSVSLTANVYNDVVIDEENDRIQPKIQTSLAMGESDNVVCSVQQPFGEIIARFIETYTLQSSIVTRHDFNHMLNGLEEMKKILDKKVREIKQLNIID